MELRVVRKKIIFFHLVILHKFKKSEICHKRTCTSYIKIKFHFKIEAKFKTYNQTCTTDWSVPCDSSVGLICPSSPTGCSCPNTLPAGYCDCPRYKFWNGTYCGKISYF